MAASLADAAVPSVGVGTLPADARVALISPYGGGNLGDAAILESSIRGIRRRLPGGEVFGLTLTPTATTERHGIAAYPCTGLRLRHYRASGAGHAGGPSSNPEDASHAQSPLAALKRAARAVPGLQEARTLGRNVGGDLRHRRRALEWLSGCRVVMVAGGGQVDDYWGGAFGHPYALWEWSSLSHRAGARFVLASVGVGTLQTPVARMFIRRALRAADYCSFRDAGSLSMAAFTGASAVVVPDLAYGLPWREVIGSAAPAAGERGAGGPPRVALSPMSYGAPDLWPEVAPAKYERHLATVVELAARMLEAGWEVVLVHSDSNDRVPAREVASRLASRLRPEQRARLETPVTDRLPDLLRALESVDFTVAARLHGVILSQVVGRPVLALSYERKVATVMREMDHMDYCLELETMDPTQAFAKLEGIRGNAEVLRADLESKVAFRRSGVEAQWDRLFGAVPAPQSGQMVRP
jgi:polysaccharide pyruvyl transferase WcaK-like protein